MSTAEIAAHLTALLGVSVRHVDLPDAAYREGAARAGLPPALIEMQSEYYAAVREGRVDIVATPVEQLLGHPPRSYAAWARDHAQAFAPSSKDRRSTG